MMPDTNNWSEASQNRTNLKLKIEKGADSAPFVQTPRVLPSKTKYIGFCLLIHSDKDLQINLR